MDNTTTTTTTTVTTSTKLIATILFFSLLILSPPRDAYCDCLATPPPSVIPPPPPSDPTPPIPTIPPPPPSDPTVPTPTIPPPTADIPPAPPSISTPPTPAIPPPQDPPMTHCPRHMLKFGACADIPGLVHAVMGNPPSGTQCCAILGGMAKLEMAMCLCTAIKANILGINLNVPIACSVILSACQQDVPLDFKCESN